MSYSQVYSPRLYPRSWSTVTTTWAKIPAMQRLHFLPISLYNCLRRIAPRLGRCHHRMTFDQPIQRFLSTYCGLLAWLLHWVVLFLLPWCNNGLVIINRLSSVDLHPMLRVCNSGFCIIASLIFFPNSTHPFLPLWGSGEFQDDDYRWKHPDVLTCRGCTVHIGTYSAPIFSQPDCGRCHPRHLSPIGIIVFWDDHTPDHLGGVSLPNTVFGACSLCRHLADEAHL